jgi:drug/metabolite transporter (DMT)-like permease
MTKDRSSLFAILEALFVAFLWSTSFIIVKFGSNDIPPLLFASLRYLVASIILLFYVGTKKVHRAELKQLNSQLWLKLASYGLLYYSLAQGFLYLSLYYMPVILISLILNFTPVIVIFLSYLFLSEKTNWQQGFFVIMAIFGALLYLLPLSEIDLPDKAFLGFLVLFLALFANGFSSVYGRAITRTKEFSAITITSISMAFGSIFMLIIALIVEGFPKLNLEIIISILILSILNTAIAFSLWHHAMQKLKAVQMSVINNTMLVHITILAIIFLDEMPTIKGWIALVIVAIGTVLVQLYSSDRKTMEKMKTKYEREANN